MMNNNRLSENQPEYSRGLFDRPGFPPTRTTVAACNEIRVAMKDLLGITNYQLAKLLGIEPTNLGKWSRRMRAPSGMYYPINSLKQLLQDAGGINPFDILLSSGSPILNLPTRSRALFTWRSPEFGERAKPITRVCDPPYKQNGTRLDVEDQIKWAEREATQIGQNILNLRMAQPSADNVDRDAAG